MKLTCRCLKFKNKVHIICSRFIHNKKLDHLCYINAPLPNFSTYSSNFRSSSLIHGPLFILGSKAFTHLHKDKNLISESKQDTNILTRGVLGGGGGMYGRDNCSELFGVVYSTPLSLIFYLAYNQCQRFLQTSLKEQHHALGI